MRSSTDGAAARLAAESRARLFSCVRSFFDSRGFIEVDTDICITAPAPEPHIDCPAVPGLGGFLRASPELQMKRLLAAGMERIYQIGPCFREGERGRRHRPEFTMLEWYRAGADFLEILADAEALVAYAADAFGRDLPHPPFPRIAVRDAYRELAGWDPFAEWDGDRFDFDMATKIEPGLPKTPVFLIGYPPQAASLAKISDGVAQRWELYLDGIELANAFSELTDAGEQRQRFSAAREERRALGETDYPLDEAFLEELPHIGAAAGCAMGMDRLAMSITGSLDIAEVRGF